MNRSEQIRSSARRKRPRKNRYEREIGKSLASGPTGPWNTLPLHLDIIYAAKLLNSCKVGDPSENSRLPCMARFTGCVSMTHKEPASRSFGTGRIGNSPRIPTPYCRCCLLGGAGATGRGDSCNASNPAAPVKQSALRWTKYLRRWPQSMSTVVRLKVRCVQD